MTAPSAVPGLGLIRVGRILGPHGLRGALRLRPDDPASNSIHSLERVFIAQDGKDREYRIEASSPLGRGATRLVLEGLNDAAAAEQLKGAIVMAAQSDLPPLQPNQFYYREAVGCEVVLSDGRSIGKVEEVFSTGANDVFVVRGEREVLVPVIADVVKSIDLQAHRITIEAVPGLLD